MKFLPPILLSVIAFVAARHLRPADASSAKPLPTGTTALPDRSIMHGLARRAGQIPLPENPTPATLDRLYRSGSLSLVDQLELLKRSAINDPEGTWDWIASQDLSRSNEYNFRNAVAEACFADHPDLILARLNPLNLDDSQIAAGLFRKLTSDDPKEAAAIRNHLDGLMSLVWVSNVWLPKPEDGGGELLLSLPPGRAKDLLISQFTQNWLGKDLTAARTWMRQLPDAKREEIMTKVVSEWIDPDYPATPEARSFVTGWLSNEASPATFAKLGPKLAAAMARENPAAALEWANRNLTAAPLANATGQIVSQLFTRDPDLARKTVEELPPGQLLHRAAAEVAKAWCAHEPEAAVHWWLDQVDSKESSKCWGYSSGHQLGKKWLDTQPDTLRENIANPEARALPESVTSVAIDGWTAEKPLATLDWIATLPEERRDVSAKTAYQTFARKDPAAAAEQYLQRPGIAAPAAAAAIANAWYRADSEAAIRWVANLPEGEARRMALDCLRKNADFEVIQGASFPKSLDKLTR